MQKPPSPLDIQPAHRSITTEKARSGKDCLNSLSQGHLETLWNDTFSDAMETKSFEDFIQGRDGHVVSSRRLDESAESNINTILVHGTKEELSELREKLHEQIKTRLGGEKMRYHDDSGRFVSSLHQNMQFVEDIYAKRFPGEKMADITDIY